MSIQNQKNVQKNRKILKNLLMYDKKNHLSPTQNNNNNKNPKKTPAPKKIERKKKAEKPEKKNQKEQPKKEKQKKKKKKSGKFVFPPPPPRVLMVPNNAGPKRLRYILSCPQYSICFEYPVYIGEIRRVKI